MVVINDFAPTDVVLPLTDANADTVSSTSERIAVVGPTGNNPPLVAGTLTGQHSKFKIYRVVGYGIEINAPKGASRILNLL